MVAISDVLSSLVDSMLRDRSCHPYHHMGSKDLSHLPSYMFMPYYSMGSGSLAALGILEAKYEENLSIENAVLLAAEAIEGGIFHDLGYSTHMIVTIDLEVTSMWPS